MKIHRKDWPAVREYSRTIKGRTYTYWQVDMRRAGYTGTKLKNFTSASLALSFAKKTAAQVNMNGVASIQAPHAFTLDTRYKHLPEWERRCQAYGKTLEDAFRAAFEVFEKEKQVQESPFISELLTLWIDDKKNNKLKPLRKRSIQSLNFMAGQFKAEFGSMRIRELTRKRVEEYLGKDGVTQQTRKNMRSYLSQFFNHCRKKQYFDGANPVADIEIFGVKRSHSFFTIQQCETLLQKAVELDIAPYIALCLFAGIRPEECQKLTWANVFLDSNEILITSDIAKTKFERRFELSENCIQWLKVAKEANKPLVHSNIYKLYSRLRKAFEVWPKDVMRKTYCSFHYAKYKDVELLRFNMGNSPEVIHKHYRSTIPKADVEQFWNIKP